jgi:hypothetical protein
LPESDRETVPIVLVRCRRVNFGRLSAIKGAYEVLLVIRFHRLSSCFEMGAALRRA